MPRQGQTLTDPVTQARLRFTQTAVSSHGSCVEMELSVQSGWSAGPRHVHPLQTERLSVVDGRFRAHLGRRERELEPGDAIDVPAGTSHTIELIGARGALVVSFLPALRTDELFETMFSAASPRRPPRFVPTAGRAWMESRGFDAEIRYLWPRRVVVALALLLIGAVVKRG